MAFEFSPPARAQKSGQTENSVFGGGTCGKNENMVYSTVAMRIPGVPECGKRKKRNEF